MLSICGAEVDAFIHLEVSQFISNWLEFRFFTHNIAVSAAREKRGCHFAHDKGQKIRETVILD